MKVNAKIEIDITLAEAMSALVDNMRSRVGYTSLVVQHNTLFKETYEYERRLEPVMLSDDREKDYIIALLNLIDKYNKLPEHLKR